MESPTRQTPDPEKAPLVQHTAPINRLPPELLSRILTYMVKWNRFGLLQGYESWSQALYFCPVCRYWRDVALSTPRLWSIITLSIDFNRRYPPIILERLLAHVKRSQNTPISFKFTINGPHADPEYLDPYLNALFDEAHRWRSFEFEAPWGFNSVLMKILESTEGKLVALESLTIDVKSLEKNMFNFLQHTTPAFHSLTLISEDSDFFTCVNLASLSIPFTQITNLHLDNITTAVLALIEVCPNLVSAHFVIPALACRRYWLDDVGVRSPKKKAAPYHLSSLTQLTIEVSESSQKSSDYAFADVAIIIHSLKAPALKSFALTTDAKRFDARYDMIASKRNDEFAATLEGFLARSPDLAYLHVDCVPLKDQDLLRVMLVVPHVTELVLREVGKARKANTSDKSNNVITKTFLDALTMKRKSSALLPQLRHIRFTFRDFVSIQKPFQKFIDSRLGTSSPHPCSTLQSAYIKFTHDGYRAFDWSHLRERQRAGLAIRVFFQWVIDDDDPYDSNDEDKHYDKDEKVFLGYDTE
ncbi:hypothetical protein VNI00_006735 [Paramarasmius palmivorus]|uniref:F-box domain-containing protein n=1 Tax=Paramarasmius palmivorus TaxID=297713 RepID=A0AAW0D7U9_9AGAR